MAAVGHHTLVFVAILQNIFQSWAIIFFSKSKGRILDELRVSFNETDKEKIMKETRRLKKPKFSQKPDTAIKFTKDNANIFSDYLFETVNSAIKTSNFLNCLKLVDLPLSKIVGETTKKTIEQLMFHQHYLEEYFLSKCQFSLTIFYQTTNPDFEKVIVRIAFRFY